MRIDQVTSGSLDDTAPMRMPELNSERLIVRALGVGDVDAVLRVLRIPSDEPADRRRIERYVEYNALAALVLAELDQPPYGDRAVVLRSSGELIGLAGLVPAFLPFDQLQDAGDRPSRDEMKASLNRPEIGLYYEIDPDHRGRGYATEAAEALVAFAFGTL